MWFGTNFPSHSVKWVVRLDARCLVTSSVPSLPFLQDTGYRGEFPSAGTVLSYQTTAPCPPKSRHGIPAELFLPQKEPKMRRGKWIRKRASWALLLSLVVGLLLKCNVKALQYAREMTKRDAISFSGPHWVEKVKGLLTVLHMGSFFQTEMNWF